MKQMVTGGDRGMTTDGIEIITGGWRWDGHKRTNDI